VCGLAETPFTVTSNLGQTFHTVVRTQYHLLRDSDPFWYEADGYFTDAEDADIRQTTFSELIQRNTNITSAPCLIMAVPDGCGMAITPPQPTQPYDFLVTLVPTSPNNALFGLENDISFAIDGFDGATILLTRGRNYTFFTQTSCSHAFFIATTPDIVIPPFAPAYTNVINQFGCSEQNTYVTLIVDDTTPSSLYYQCAFHNFMGGNISIVASLPTGASSVVVPPTQPVQPTVTSPPTTSPQTTSPAIVTVPVMVSNIAAVVVASVVIPVMAVVILVLVVLLFIFWRRQQTYNLQRDSVPMTDK